MSRHTSTTGHDVQTAHHDVLVVGAGPAGLTAAITLARAGVDVLVIEKHAGTSPFPKATGVSTRTMELLRTWGVEQQVRGGALGVQPLFSVSETLVGPVWATQPFGYPTDEQALAVSPVTPGCVAQDHLEPVLVDHLRERGGTIRFRTELTALHAHPGRVMAELTELTTGRPHRVHARYVIGADGPRSTVRDAVGVDIDDLGTMGEFLSVTFRADLTRRLGRIPSALNAVEAAGAQGLFVPTGTNDRWIFAREWHPSSGESLADWPKRRIIDLLRIGAGVPDLAPDILAVMPFAMGGHVARAFRVGRVFLVGDAAHRTTPVGGIGMNTAIHGAHNLGWKLAWVLRGWAGEELLDSYETERRPIATANVVRSLQRSEPTGDGLAWDVGVRYESAMIADRPGTGERAPHVWVGHRGRRMSTLDLFDGRLTVITGPDGEPWRRAAAELAAEGLPIVALSAGRDLTDESGKEGGLAEAYRLGRSGAVLVRPDGYLAWHIEAAIGESVAGGSLAALRSAVDLVLGYAVSSDLGQVA